jgi:hypothetical protein
MVVMVGTGTLWTVSPLVVPAVLVVMPGSWVWAGMVVMAVWARSWGTG